MVKFMVPAPLFIRFFPLANQLWVKHWFAVKHENQDESFLPLKILAYINNVAYL